MARTSSEEEDPPLIGFLPFPFHNNAMIRIAGLMDSPHIPGFLTAPCI
jgi:hypothetical protein